MNDTAFARRAQAVNECVAHLFAAQQAACSAHPVPTAGEQLHALKALKRQVQRYQDPLAAAMSEDFGYRAPAESKMLDLLGSVLEF